MNTAISGASLGQAMQIALFRNNATAWYAYKSIHCLRTLIPVIPYAHKSIIVLIIQVAIMAVLCGSFVQHLSDVSARS
jgi:hypothetical protein